MVTGTVTGNHHAPVYRSYNEPVDRRSFHRTLLTGAASGLLMGCGQGTPWRVGVHAWPGYETLTLAERLGWLPPGITLSHGQSAVDSMQGLRSGQLDAAALTLDETIALRCEGVPVRVVLVFNESVGADQVVLRDGTPPPTAETPLRIAVESNTLGILVFRQWLRALNAPAIAFELVNLAPAQQPDAWRAGAVDAAVTYPPYASQLTAAGGTSVFDSRQFPGLVLDVLAVREARMGWTDRAGLQSLLAAHFKGLAHMRQNPEDAMRRIATWRSLSYREVSASYAGINQPDEAGNRRMLASGGAVESAVRTLDSLMREVGRMQGACDLAALHDAQYLP